MKAVIFTTAFLAITAIMGVGVFVIFGVISMDTAGDVLLKSLGAIVLIGVCSALMSLMMGKEEPVDNEPKQFRSSDN
jgi:hypothetical protein